MIDIYYLLLGIYLLLLIILIPVTLVVGNLGFLNFEEEIKPCPEDILKNGQLHPYYHKKLNNLRKTILDKLMYYRKDYPDRKARLANKYLKMNSKGTVQLEDIYTVDRDELEDNLYKLIKQFCGIDYVFTVGGSIIFRRFMLLDFNSNHSKLTEDTKLTLRAEHSLLEIDPRLLPQFVDKYLSNEFFNKVIDIVNTTEKYKMLSEIGAD